MKSFCRLTRQHVCTSDAASASFPVKDNALEIYGGAGRVAYIRVPILKRYTEFNSR